MNFASVLPSRKLSQFNPISGGDLEPLAIEVTGDAAARAQARIGDEGAPSTDIQAHGGAVRELSRDLRPPILRRHVPRRIRLGANDSEPRRLAGARRLQAEVCALHDQELLRRPNPPVGLAAGPQFQRRVRLRHPEDA